MDDITYLIILRALFIYSLIEKGWCLRKIKKSSHSFEMFKSVKN
jgi:hypothetical protein